MNSSTGILALRTYALYYHNKTFKRVLILLYVLVIAILIVCLVIEAADVKIQRAPPGLTCLMGVVPNHNHVLIVQYSAPVAYNGLIFILTVSRILSSWRNVRIVKVILRDCLLYYTVMVVTGIASIWLFISLPIQRSALNEILVQPMRALSVILASRLVLRLREYVREPSMSLSTLSTPPNFESND